MAKNDFTENVAVVIAGGILTGAMNAYNGYYTASMMLWGFVTGVLVVSLALVIGKLVASRFG